MTAPIARHDWPRLLALVEQALDLPVAERDAWLAALALDAPLQSALQGLLDERRALETDDFLAALPVIPAPATAPGRLTEGTLIGPWRLLREIGQGGMSTVWLAERADDQLTRQVALKLPHAGPGQDLLAARLLRERNILAALEHRNIARLYDVGLTDAGTPYLVMEFVQGTDLLSHADAHRLGIAQRLALFQQVLRAVQYAHAKLVLHRDLKPGNILVNDAGDVKLLDFGIAKVLAEGHATHDETELTRAAGRQLTLHYASPEQLRGEPLGTASDVYSLGVILFELLTGERPYALARDSRAALEEAVLAAEPRRPSQAWPASRSADAFGSTAPAMRRALGGDLDVIVLTALHKQPAQRYATVDAMAQDLLRHLTQEPILAQPSSAWVRLRKFGARHAVAVGAGAAIFAALGLGLGAALWQGQQARQEADKATAIKNFLVTLLRGNDLDQDNAPAKRRQTVQQVLEQSASALATELRDQPEVRDELQGLVGDLLNNLNLLDAAIPLRQQRAQDLAARDAPLAQQVSALRELAESQNSQLPAARASLEQAWALCQRESDARTAPACLGARLDLGRNLLAGGDLAPAQAHIEAAAPPLMAVAEPTLERAAAARTLGELRATQNRLADADALHQRALADFQAVWGPASSRLAMEQRLHANQLALHQRFADAIAAYKSAWRTRVQAAGDSAIGSAKLELELGHLQARVGLDEQGDAHVRHASAVLLASQGPERAELVFNARRVLAELQIYSGRLSLAGPALAELDEAARTHSLSASNAHDLDVLHALYEARTGQFQAALQRLTHRREAIAAQRGPDAVELPSLDRRLIDTLLAADDLAGAEALAHQRNTPMPDEVLLAQGRFDAAWPGVQARWQQVQARPRGDQYRFSVVRAHEQAARALAGLGRHGDALPAWRAAIAAQTPGHPHDPVLAALRAHLAQSLIALGDMAGARTELARAEAALRAEPLAGPQFWRPWRAAQGQLAQAMKKV